MEEKRMHGMGRFFVEFLRADERGNVGILSTSQFIAIFMLLLGIVILWFRRDAKNR